MSAPSAFPVNPGSLECYQKGMNKQYMLMLMNAGFLSSCNHQMPLRKIKPSVFMMYSYYTSLTYSISFTPRGNTV